jgi:hypothetical protein
MTEADVHRRTRWLDRMYLRFTFACWILAVLAAVLWFEVVGHVRPLLDQWLDESQSFTTLAVLALITTVAAAAAGLGAFLSRALAEITGP